ncbi:MAG: DUF2961 domain-containing protein [Candidatus Omnitrophica bacterium]|nr:hypothetical protein [bacterium]NUN97792.1 DUF2961 domain-containing protein [Candidatus Omnitrophota bacterium]
MSWDLFRRVCLGGVLLVSWGIHRVCAGPLDDLTRLRNETSWRASSSGEPWQTSNGDCRPIPPGETLVLADLEGPGEVRHIWFTVSAEDEFYPRSMVLRVYYDDRAEPGVESPLGDFFGVGHGLRKDYQSLPLEISSEGRALNCFWRMPFGKRIRIEMTNESDRPVRCLYSYIDWVALPSLPHGTAYFHAQYRQERPCRAGERYLILDTEGRGHYVGTVLSVLHSEASWFGEGDDFIYIDGAAEPTLKGTGTEDYFCDAWGFREFQQLNHGVTIWEGYDAGDRGTAYRWHIQDPIRFSKSIRFEIEHMGARVNPDGTFVSGFIERADDYASVAFWYQEGLPKRFAPLPPLSERVRPTQLFEAEASRAGIVHSTGEIQVQEGDYSGGKQVLFVAGTSDATLSLPFVVEKAAKGILRVDLTTSWDYGTYEVRLDDGAASGPHDFYSASIKNRAVKFPVSELSSGPHQLHFKCLGSNSASKFKGSDRQGFNLGIDSIELIETP